MLLQRIELNGFLSYGGVPGASGQVEPVAIDLRSSSLWLVYGRNGAGKSALFDAITFALYKHHRGGKSNFNDLINDAADKAEIGLEIELNGVLYLVQRKITRLRRGSKVWGIVRRWTGVEPDPWQAVPGTENRVEEWVHRHVRMSYETFVSAVVLRQGEADAFFDAEPAQRKDRLLELLDLEFYRKLGEAANVKRTQWHNHHVKCKEELDGLQVVTAADVDEQRKIRDRANTKVEQAGRYLRQKGNELSDAELAAGLLQKISQMAQQRRDDDELISHAVTIMATARRYRELTSILPYIRHLWEARYHLQYEQSRIRKVRRQIVIANIIAQRLANRCAQAKRDEASVVWEHEEGAGQLRLAKEQQRENMRKVEHLDHIERLEERVARAQRKLDPYISLLEQAEHIVRDADRHRDLSAALPLLQALTDRIARVAEARRILTDAERAVTEVEHKAIRARAKEARLHRTQDDATAAYEGTWNAANACANQLALLGEKLGARDSLAQHDDCPTCGSNLTSEETRARLRRERAHWTEQVSTLERRKSELAGQMETYSHAQQDASAAHDAAAKASQTVATTLTRLRNDVDHAYKAVMAAKAEANAARRQVGRWVNELKSLAALIAEADSLCRTPGRAQQLAAAREVENAARAEMVFCHDELAHLPTWSPDERAGLRAASVLVDDAVRACTERMDEAGKRVDAAREGREGVERKQNRTRTKLRVQCHHITDLERRRTRANQDIARRYSGMPATWASHSACTNARAMQALEEELTGLSTAEADEECLRDAQARVTEIAGAIKALQAQLEQIPVERRRDVDIVEQEKVAAEKELQAKIDAREEHQERLRQLDLARQTYDACARRKIEADCELYRYSRLAQAFGREGLQAQIVRRAQQDIVSYANTTLARLSNGTWQIEVRENERGTELTILARDLSRPQMPVRAFEYLSGGEKFRVAISVAIAIGQSVSGGRTVDTLVIDEGFGSLDEVNRDLLVAELRRLSEEVLCGGRIIIVSHEADVIEEFGSRYFISKDTDGATVVECTVL